MPNLPCSWKSLILYSKVCLLGVACLFLATCRASDPPPPPVQTAHTERPAASSTNAAELRPVQWSPKLQLRSLADVDRRLAQPFEEPVEVRRYSSPKDRVRQQNAEVAKITDCASFLELRRKGFNPRSDLVERYLQAVGTDCYALAALKNAAPARSSYLTNFHLDETALQFLPPSGGVVISSEDVKKVADAQAKGLSWKQYEPDLNAHRANTDELVVEGKGWVARLEIYGRGDFDGDGVEDLLLKTQGSMKEGTYVNTRLLLLSRTQDNAVLKLIREFP